MKGPKKEWLIIDKASNTFKTEENRIKPSTFGFMLQKKHHP
jgi:hypothetical protein